MNNAYVKAFTIVEAAVSLILTAIIISLVYVIFNITAQRLSDFKNQSETESEFGRLNYSINKSIFENEKILLADNAFSFIDFEGNLSEYLISNKEIVYHRGAFTDTFKLFVEKLRIDTIASAPKNMAYIRLRVKLKNENLDADEVNFYKRLFTADLIREK